MLAAKGLERGGTGDGWKFQEKAYNYLSKNLVINQLLTIECAIIVNSNVLNANEC